MSCLGFYLGPVLKTELSAFDNCAVHSSGEPTAFSTFMRVVWDNIRGYGWLQTTYLMYDLGPNRMWISHKALQIREKDDEMTNARGPSENMWYNRCKYGTFVIREPILWWHKDGACQQGFPMLNLTLLTHQRALSTAGVTPLPRRTDPSVETPGGQLWSEQCGTELGGLRRDSRMVQKGLKKG